MISNAAVTFDKEKNIMIAFVIRKPETKNQVTEEQIYNYLSLGLPNYMMSSKIVWVNDLIYT